MEQLNVQTPRCCLSAFIFFFLGELSAGPCAVTSSSPFGIQSAI